MKRITTNSLKYERSRRQRITPLPEPAGKLCPACLVRKTTFKGEAGAGSAFSRYASIYICSACGTKEAFEGFFWRAHCDAHLIKPHHR